MGQISQTSNAHKYTKIYIEIALLALLCVSQYIGISILNLALTGAIICIHFLMEDIDESVIGLFCALPEFNLMNTRIGSTSLYYLMIMVFWLRYFQHHEWKISKTKFLILLAFLVIRFSSNAPLKGTLTWFLLLSVLVLTFNEDFFDKNIIQIVFFTSTVFLLSSLAGYLMLKAGKSIYTGGNVWVGNVKSIRFAGIIGDAVFFSQFCSLLAAANLTLGCHNKRYLIPALIFAGSCLVLCLESYAKTGMLLIALCVVASVVWFIWDRLQNKRTALLSIFLIFASLIALVFLINYILTNTDNLILQNYISRLSSDDLLTGRLELWAYYIGMLVSNWCSLFIALPHSQYSVPVFITADRGFDNPHNIYLESACLFGIIPTLCMLTLIFVMMYQCFVRRKGILWQMPICVILASGFTLHGHREFQYYTLVAIALSFLSTNHKPTGEQSALTPSHIERSTSEAP